MDDGSHPRHDGNAFCLRSFSSFFVAPLLERISVSIAPELNPMATPAEPSRMASPITFSPHARGKTIAVMPAYNAARTLERTVADIPPGTVDEIILVDDCSRDNTVEIAERLGLTVIRHEKNLGYGGNQKTCYQLALERGALQW